MVDVICKTEQGNSACLCPKIWWSCPKMQIGTACHLDWAKSICIPGKNIAVLQITMLISLGWPWWDHRPQTITHCILWLVWPCSWETQFCKNCLWPSKSVHKQLYHACRIDSHHGLAACDIRITSESHAFQGALDHIVWSHVLLILKVWPARSHAASIYWYRDCCYRYISFRERGAALIAQLVERFTRNEEVCRSTRHGGMTLMRLIFFSQV